MTLKSRKHRLQERAPRERERSETPLHLHPFPRPGIRPGIHRRSLEVEITKMAPLKATETLTRVNAAARPAPLERHRPRGPGLILRPHCGRMGGRIGRVVEIPGRWASRPRDRTQSGARGPPIRRLSRQGMDGLSPLALPTVEGATLVQEQYPAEWRLERRSRSESRMPASELTMLRPTATIRGSGVCARQPPVARAVRQRGSQWARRVLGPVRRETSKKGVAREARPDGSKDVRERPLKPLEPLGPLRKRLLPLVCAGCARRGRRFHPSCDAQPPCAGQLAEA